MKEIARQLVLPFFAVLALRGCEKTPAPPSASPPATPSPAAANPASPTPSPAGESTGDAEKTSHLLLVGVYPAADRRRIQRRDRHQSIHGDLLLNEEMLAKLFAGGGNYDIIQPSEYVIEGLIKEGLLTPIDHARIANMKNLASEFTNMSFDPGNKYSVPYMAGTVGIVVNTGLVQDDIKGYNDVFQEKFAKNIVVLDDAREIVSWGLESLGIPVNEVSDENLAKVNRCWRRWLPSSRSSIRTARRQPCSMEMSPWESSGPVRAPYCSTRIRNLNGSSRRTAHISFVDSLAIPKSAKHVQNAELFINYVLRPNG